MATFRIPILTTWAKPSDSDVFFEPVNTKLTTALWNGMVLVFNDTSTRIGCAGRFTVPKNYVGSPNIIVAWSTSATTGNVRWEFDYRAIGGNDVESYNQGTNQESVGVTDAAPSAAWERMEASMALTAGNLAADDDVMFEIFRDGADTVNDTIAAATLIFQLLFEYTDV